ncbi:MAG: arsenate reductase [Frankiales bacterium]|nr:arsenate reductase [Frankiales bacterium]
MSELTIWHNPRCSKSRGALALLTEQGETPTVVRYLDEPPSRAELVRVVGLLGGDPRVLLRTGEPEYADLGLATAGDEAVLDALAAHPRLIERPVVLRDGRAVLGRPPERVLDLLLP